MNREAAPLLLAAQLLGEKARETFKRIGYNKEGLQSTLPYPLYRPSHKEAITEGIEAGKGFPSSVRGFPNNVIRHQTLPLRKRMQASGQDYCS